jgi:DNA polymerase V
MSALGHHISHVVEKLRQDGCVASKLTIVARASRFGSFAHREGSMSITLVLPTNDTFTFVTEVSRLLDLLYDPEIPYKKAGIIASGIEPVEIVTGSLFENGSRETKTSKLNMVTDALNHKFGSGTVRHAVTLGDSKWKERKELKSPEYTTSWSEIASIKAT